MMVSFTIIYTHDGAVDVRDTIHTADIIYELLKEITPSLTNLELTINGTEINNDDLIIRYISGGLAYERIRKIYLAINKPFKDVTTTDFTRLYTRRHNCTTTIGIHARRCLYAMGFFTGDDIRWFWTKDPDKDDNPAEVEFYSLPRHTLKMSDMCRMYRVLSEYVYPDSDTKYTLAVHGRLLLDTEPEEMHIWMNNPEFKIENIDFLRNRIDETDKCSADDFFESLYDARPGWRP